MSLSPSYLAQLEEQYGLPRGLLATQMKAESGGNAAAVSPKGALGLFQFMPETAKQYGIDPLNEEQSAQGAARLNADNLQRYGGDLPSALAAYNWGPGNVDRKGIDKAPEETKNYISKIMSGIGDMIIPSAQASEMHDDVPPGFVPEEQVAQPSALSSIGSSPNLPPEQQVQAAPLEGESDVPPGFVPEEDAHQSAVADDVAAMGQGVSGAGKQLGSYALNSLQAIPFSDEIISGLGALMGGGTGSFGQNYNALQQGQQAFREAGQQINPGATALGQLSGTLATARFLPAPAKGSESIGGAIAQGLGYGTGYGLAYGSGDSNSFLPDKEAAQGRVSNAISGAETGAITGGVLNGTLHAILPKAGQITSNDLRAQGSALYQQAEKTGGILKPNIVDSFVDDAAKTLPQTEAGKIVAGESPATKLIDSLQQIKGKPLTLNAAQEIDEAIGNQIDNFMDKGSLTKDGKKLLDIQNKFRSMIESAGQNDIVGTKDGFDALKQAREVWSQSLKMRDIERIIENGKLSDNPATSIRSGFKTLQKNPARFNRYNAQQKALINKAGKSGLTQEALRAIGSRLLTISATGAGYVGGGIPGAIVSNLASAAIGAGARKLAGGMQASRGQKVVDAVLGNTSAKSSKLNKAAALLTTEEVSNNGKKKSQSITLRPRKENR